MKRETPKKCLATIILDKYLKEVYNTIVIESPGKLASKGNKDPLLLVNSTGIQKRIFNTKRKKLNNILYKRQILYKLIQITYLGILFDPDI
jgi:hypothetical protein